MKWIFDKEYNTWHTKEGFWILKEKSKFILEYRDLKLQFKKLSSAKTVARLIKEG